MTSSIPPLNLNSLPPSAPSQKTNQTVKAEGISFDAGAINNAEILLNDPDNLKNVLIEKLMGEPPFRPFGSQEGKVATDIINHLLPSFFSDPNKFAIDLLKNINNKEAPQFLNNLAGGSEIPQESWKALLQDKTALKNVFTAIDQALITSDGATSRVLLLQPLIDKIGDDKSSAPTPAVASKATNPKKLLTLGNAVKLGLIGLAAGTVTELTGITDFSSLGPNKGVTPPPGQVITNKVMKAITSFPGKDISSASQDTIQSRIDTNLNIAKAGDASLTLTPSAYYGNTLEPLSINGKNQGSKVQANIKLNPNEEDKPFLLIYQEGKTSVQITAVPLDAAKAEHLKQPPNSKVIAITLPAGGKPTIKTEEADLTPLL
jgi:hypothetical protein